MKGKGGYDWDNGGAEKKRKLNNGPPDTSQELGQYMGTIKSFSENNGYGFISCPDMQMLGYNDVFLHHQQLNGFQVGADVYFTCYLTPRGQPQAKDLQVGGQAI